MAGPVGCRGGLGNYREATNGDIRELKKVAFAAWSHAYRGIYEPSTIRRKVSAHYSTTALEAAIEKAKAGETFFFVTSDEGGIVGYANGGRISSPWMDPSKTGGKSYDISAWELTRIYLLPEVYRPRDRKGAPVPMGKVPQTEARGQVLRLLQQEEHAREGFLCQERVRQSQGV